MTALDAKGVAVTIDAHQCMTTRGIKKKASTVTNYYLGLFKEDLEFKIDI